MTLGPSPFSSLRDDHARGSVADFLRQHLKPGADLDLVTAYFTVFAFAGLRDHLENLGRVRLLFGEAAFIKNVDPKGADPAAYVLRDDGLALSAGLSQRHVAEACARWLRDRVDVRSVTRTGFLHGKMSHIHRGEISSANPLDAQNFEDLVAADLRLRDRQLVRLPKEILDLEDFEDSVTLADFSLDDFRLDLLRYLEATS